MYFFYLGGYKIQMLRWLNTDMSSQDKRLLLLQFKDCETGMMLQQRGDFSCLCGRGGRLGLIKVQDGHCTKLRPSMRWGNCWERGVSSWEGGHHMFWTVCQVGDRTSPVSGYMSKNKNYSSRLKRRRCSHPSQIVCEYKPQKVPAESWSRTRGRRGNAHRQAVFTPSYSWLGIFFFFTWLTLTVKDCQRPER